MVSIPRGPSDPCIATVMNTPPQHTESYWKVFDIQSKNTVNLLESHNIWDQVIMCELIWNLCPGLKTTWFHLEPRANSCGIWAQGWKTIWIHMESGPTAQKPCDFTWNLRLESEKIGQRLSKHVSLCSSYELCIFWHWWTTVAFCKLSN